MLRTKFSCLQNIYPCELSFHENKKAFVCTFGNCKLTFSRRGVHDKKKPHNCEKCEKTYSQKSHLNEHISRFHENIKKFACDNCDKKFTEKKSLLFVLLEIASLHSQEEMYWW